MLRALLFLLIVSSLVLQACSPEVWNAAFIAAQTNVAATKTKNAFCREVTAFVPDGCPTWTERPTATVFAGGPHVLKTQAALETGFVGTQTAYAHQLGTEAVLTRAAGGGVFVSVTVDTFCRSGPGVEYKALTMIAVGEVVEVVAVYSGSEYVVVRRADGSECWLWLRYAEPSDFSKSGLPEATLPPPPTPTDTPRPPRKPTATPTFTIN